MNNDRSDTRNPDQNVPRNPDQDVPRNPDQDVPRRQGESIEPAVPPERGKDERDRNAPVPEKR